MPLTPPAAPRRPPRSASSLSSLIGAAGRAGGVGRGSPPAAPASLASLAPSRITDPYSDPGWAPPSPPPSYPDPSEPPDDPGEAPGAAAAGGAYARWRRGVTSRPRAADFRRAVVESVVGATVSEIVQQALPAEYARLVEILGVVPVASALFRGESPIPAVLTTLAVAAARQFIHALIRFLNAVAIYHKSDKRAADKKALKGAWVDFLRHPIDVPMETMQKVALFGASLAQKAPKAKASKAKASKAPKVAGGAKPQGRWFTS